jgi:hypothetical protein
MVPQKAKPKPVRPTVQLEHKLEKTLSAYTMAALAAGVSFMAASKLADGKVVYTPAHTKIPVNNSTAVPLDLNHDGAPDFSFLNLGYYGGSGETARALLVGCAAHRVNQYSFACNHKDNMIWGQGVVSTRFASLLPAGRTIAADKSYFRQAKSPAPGHVLGPAASMAGNGGSNGVGVPFSVTFGQWLYTRGHYLGLQFVIKGRIHYGWARVNVQFTPRSGILGILTGYAYETISNKPIIAGRTKGPDVVTLQPATLGHLAKGASAIPVWRVKQTAATTY